MQYVFAIFVFGSMISLLVLKGLIQAQDLANEKLKEDDARRQMAESALQQAETKVG